MKTTLLSLMFSLAILANSPAQEVRFAVNQGLASSGDLCASFRCVPDTLTALRGFPVGLNLSGAVGQPHYLLLGLPSNSCIAVPGFHSSLIGQPLGIFPMPLTWGRVYGNGGQGQCAAWIGFGHLQLPANLPVGSKALLQFLAPAWNPERTAQVWTFSNAVELTFR
jgi:hypothetical protein